MMMLIWAQHAMNEVDGNSSTSSSQPFYGEEEGEEEGEQTNASDWKAIMNHPDMLDFYHRYIHERLQVTSHTTPHAHVSRITL